MTDSAAIIEDAFRTALDARGADVIYYRDGHSMPLRAVPTRYAPSGEDVGRVAVSTDDQDYLLLSADLSIGGEKFEPKRGDQLDDGGRVFEVWRGDQDREFRYADHDRVVLRVHTKFKEEYSG